jgi:hypothetical protein
VDAGYVFSGGTTLMFGQRLKRHEVHLANPRKLIDAIVARAASCCDGDPLRVLRTYWYDGAFNGIPSPDQITIGELPRVKLRLGRVSAGGQKGVDGLIILDLVNLARNRAVDTAVLFSGDEDLREAALYAQGFGVSLVVCGFEPSAGQRQSELLLREADHVVRLDRRDLDGVFLATPGVADVDKSSAAGERRPSNLAGSEAAEVEAEAEEETQDATTAHEAGAEETLRQVCGSVVVDLRLRGEPIVGTSGNRLTHRADRMLVARLAELTGRFPVDAEVLGLARAICLELQQQPTT